jgi:hypothetical protein
MTKGKGPQAIPLTRGLALVTRQSYDHYGADFLRQLYPHSDIYVDGQPLDALEAELNPHCGWCGGDYIESTGPDIEDYGGYAHAQDCGVLVFAYAMVATVEAEDAERAR